MRKFVLITLLMLSALSLSAQVQVKGVVKAGDDGQPMIGASVFEKGTLNGVVTDIDGQYVINVTRGDVVLVFSSVGFKTQEVAVDNRGVIDVTLDVDNQLLDEVVVMGYSSKTRGEITSAVTTVSAEKLKDVVSSNIGDMLQGKVAGVNVIKGSGQPGENPTIRIRGTSSMSASSDPLYVVDGIIGGSYDPDDVETVTVLKDAGSTGMYGAQANGGVIVITTKKAKQEKLTVNFKANFGLAVPDFSRQKQMGSKDLYLYMQEYFRNPETGYIDYIGFNNLLPPSVLDTDTDWRGILYGPAFSQNYHASVMGRTEKNSYYTSVSFYDEDGTLQNTDFKRINVRSNNTYRPTKWLSITNNINLYASMDNVLDELLVYYVNGGIPFDNPYDENGKPIPYGSGAQIYNQNKVNPLVAYEGDNLKKGNDNYGIDYDLILDFKIAPWLTFTSQTRASVSTYSSHYHRAEGVEYMYAGDAIHDEMAMNYGGITTNMLKAEGKWGRHSLNGLLGYESQMSWYKNVYGQGTGLPYGLHVLSVASSGFKVAGTKTKSGMQSLISQANYNFDQRYFITASFRVDQSSTFAKDNRTAVFPSLSGAWVVSNERFFNSDIISSLKFKASWGKTGMKDIGASKYLESYAYNSSYSGYSSAVPTQMSNDNLKWEQTDQFNAGAEVDITDRVTVDLNWYHNVTNNLLIYRSLMPSGGFSNQWQNFGSVLNTGFEAALNVTPIKKGEFLWEVDFSISYNKNKLFNFGDEVIYKKANWKDMTQVYRDGVALYTWYLREYSGVDPQTGRHQFINETGQKTFDAAEARYIECGTPIAPWQGGVSTFVTYKNFKLSASGSYAWGNMLYGRRRASSLQSGVGNSLMPSNEDVIWRKPGDNATIGSPTYALASVYSTGGLVPGDFFKIRNVTLSYTLPKKFMKACGLTLSLSADNLATFTTVWGADPEVGIVSYESIVGEIQGLDYRYPNKRQYTFQINFTF